MAENKRKMIQAYEKTLGLPFVIGNRTPPSKLVPKKKPGFVNRMRSMFTRKARGNATTNATTTTTTTNTSAVGAGAGPAYSITGPQKRYDIPENVGSHIMGFVTGEKGSLNQQKKELSFQHLRNTVLEKRNTLESENISPFLNNEAWDDYETSLLHYRKLLKSMKKPNNGSVYLHAGEERGGKRYYNAYNEVAHNFETMIAGMGVERKTRRRSKHKFQDRKSRRK